MLHWLVLPCFGEQLGGGGYSSDTGSTSDDSVSDSDVLETLKKKKRELKAELSQIRKQIFFLEAKKGAKEKSRKKKSTTRVEGHQDKNRKASASESIPVEGDISITESLLERCTFEYILSDEERGKNEGHHIGSEIVKEEEDKEKGTPIETKVEPCKEKEENLGLMKTGQKFRTHAEFESALDKYCRATFTNVRKEKSWATKAKQLKGSPDYPYRRIHYHCVNYGVTKKRNFVDGSRPNQTYCATGCGFQLQLALNARESMYEVKHFCEEHSGHTPNPDSFKNHRKNKRLTKDETQLYIDKYMIDLKVPTHKVQEEILKNTGKIPSGNNLIRYRQTLQEKRGKLTDMQELIKLLEQLQKNDSQATVQIAYAESEKQIFCESGKKIVKVVFFQTGKMKELFSKHGKILCVDGTYNLCNNQYVLVPFHVIDNHFRTRVCGFSLLSNETEEVMRTALEMFKNANESMVQNLRYLIVDKDFVEISSAGNVFPGAKSIICQWHALKRVEAIIHKVSLPSNLQHLKADLKNNFRTMVKTSSEEEYHTAWNTVVTLGQRHPEIESTVKYLAKNWHAHRSMFCTHILETYPLYLTFTNNRAENFNMQLKRIIKRQSPVSDVVENALKIANAQQIEATRLDVKSHDKTLLPADGDSSVVELMKRGRGLLSHETLQKIRVECEEASHVPLQYVKRERNQFVCTLVSGNCTFAQNFELPCRHLLATRKANFEPLLEKEMIPEQWLLDSPRKIEKNLGSDVQGESKPLFIKRNETARKAKYRSNAETMKDMASAMSQFPESERSHLTYQLELLMNAWNNGIKTEISDSTINFLVSPRKQRKDSTKDEEEEPKTEDFIFSPKKENKHHKTAGNNSKSGKKRLFSDMNSIQSSKPNAVGGSKNDMEQWQKDVLENFRTYFKAEKDWVKSDFDKFSNPSLSGAAAYLNDRIFHYVLLMMKNQFPHIKGLQDTVDYKHSGLKRVDPPDIFLQPAHSGALHWTLLTNMSLTDEERKEGNKICLFDSMVHLSKRSEFEAEVPSAVMWQAAQLCRKKQWKKAIPIDVYGMPCAQQENGHDCGMHTIMNMVALAFGHDPSKIVYKSNGRKELLEMICHGSLKMFEYEKYCPNGEYRSRFSVLTSGQLKKRVQLEKTTMTMLPLCHCQLPESWDNVIFCSKCSQIYHQKCHFMGPPASRGRSIADTIDTFVCFSCRKPGEYVDSCGNALHPNIEAIEEVANKIDQLESYKLCAHYHFLINEQKNVPTNVREYETLMTIIAKYDLNTLALPNPKSRLYVSLKNFHNRHAAQLPSKITFETVGVPEVTLFAVAVICDIEGEECPPIFEKPHSFAIDEDLEKVYVQNKFFSATIESNIQLLSKKVQQLNKKMPQQKIQDLLSYTIAGLRDTRQRVSSLNLTLTEVEEAKATKKHKQWRQEVMLKCGEALCQLNQLDNEVKQH